MTTTPTKEELREAAPDLAGFVDDVRNVFGPVKITYIKVDSLNFEMGTPIDPVNLVQMANSTPVHVLKEQWKKQAVMDQEAHARRMGKKTARKNK
jgi:hypothetical protein